MTAGDKHNVLGVKRPLFFHAGKKKKKKNCRHHTKSQRGPGQRVLFPTMMQEAVIFLRISVIPSQSISTLKQQPSVFPVYPPQQVKCSPLCMFTLIYSDPLQGAIMTFQL